jgi:formylglycine-generating enzyme required for sulfatase activity
MTDILKKFLLDDARRFGSAGRFVGLAAFGKHPGWDDHVEDLGLESDSLNQAKIAFYVNGIGGQIDSGAWEKLDPAQQLPGFKHLFLWERSGQFLLGRLWSSSDGKGRKRYPMVVCLHFIGVSLRWALAQGLPVLAELEDKIRNTNSAEDVRSLLNAKRSALRAALPSAESGGEYAPVSPDALSRILHPGGDPNYQGFLRVLYQMDGQFKTFAGGNRTRTGQARPQQIRVPSAADSPEQVFLFWTRFFLTKVDPSTPLLLCLPLDEHWVDITAGDPESHEFFSLRASPKAVPLVSEVPYTLDGNFLTGARTFLDAFQRGETTTPPSVQPAQAEKPSTPSKGGLLKWLGVGCVLILGIAAAVVFSRKGLKSPSTQTAGDAPVTNAQPAVAASKPSVPEQPPPLAIQPAAKPPEPAKPVQVASAAKPVATNPPASATIQKETTSEKPIEPVAVVKPPPAAASLPAPAPNEVATTPSPAPSVPKSSDLNPALNHSSEVAVTPTPTAPVAAPPTPAPAPESTPTVAVVSPAASSSPAPSSVMTNTVGMVFVLMPSGLWVQKFEITWAEYARVMAGSNNDPRMPVNRVSWDDANEFCRRLTERESSTLKGKVYSLPSVKQWEEFRAGQKLEDLPSGSLKKSSQAPSAVTETATNNLGLFGVLGNVWEWTLDDGADNKKLQKGGEYGNTNYDRSVAHDLARPLSGFRCVLK